ncbi:metallophosphoesterase [Neolewinella antarctica]|uniref:metallophosphoesterase n=1 Tax=Neolewinella antarctica TaxID=442734 RepID=UPI00143A2B14
MSRRNFLRTAAGLSLAGAATGLYTWQIEPYWLEFVHRKLPIVNLPETLRGKTLVQISDMHVGDRFDYQYILDSFVETQKLNPEIVVYTGDFVSYDGPEQLTQLRNVMANAALGSVATVAILGNHDYGRNWREAGVDESISKVLKDSGITVLRNTTADVKGLNIIGVDDLWGTNFDPTTALANYQPEAANLVLCHNPDVCDLDVWNGYQGWILSGHTHGGQCKPPFLPPPLLPVENERYTAGHFDLGDGRDLYINRALGCSFPVRFNVRPEITVFELSKAAV